MSFSFSSSSESEADSVDSTLGPDGDNGDDVSLALYWIPSQQQQQQQHQQRPRLAVAASTKTHGANGQRNNKSRSLLSKLPKSGPIDLDWAMDLSWSESSDSEKSSCRSGTRVMTIPLLDTDSQGESDREDEKEEEEREIESSLSETLESEDHSLGSKPICHSEGGSENKGAEKEGKKEAETQTDSTLESMDPIKVIECDADSKSKDAVKEAKEEAETPTDSTLESIDPIKDIECEADSENKDAGKEAKEEAETQTDSSLECLDPIKIIECEAVPPKDFTAGTDDHTASKKRAQARECLSGPIDLDWTFSDSDSDGEDEGNGDGETDGMAAKSSTFAKHNEVPEDARDDLCSPIESDKSDVVAMLGNLPNSVSSASSIHSSVAGTPSSDTEVTDANLSVPESKLDSTSTDSSTASMLSVETEDMDSGSLGGCSSSSKSGDDTKENVADDGESMASGEPTVHHTVSQEITEDVVLCQTDSAVQEKIQVSVITPDKTDETTEVAAKNSDGSQPEVQPEIKVSDTVAFILRPEEDRPCEKNQARCTESLLSSSAVEPLSHRILSAPFDLDVAMDKMAGALLSQDRNETKEMNDQQELITNTEFDTVPPAFGLSTTKQGRSVVKSNSISTPCDCAEIQSDSKIERVEGSPASDRTSASEQFLEDKIALNLLLEDPGFIPCAPRALKSQPADTCGAENDLLQDEEWPRQRTAWFKMFSKRSNGGDKDEMRLATMMDIPDASSNVGEDRQDKDTPGEIESNDATTNSTGKIPYRVLISDQESSNQQQSKGFPLPHRRPHRSGSYSDLDSKSGDNASETESETEQSDDMIPLLPSLETATTANEYISVEAGELSEIDSKKPPALHVHENRLKSDGNSENKGKTRALVKNWEIFSEHATPEFRASKLNVPNEVLPESCRVPLQPQAPSDKQNASKTTAVSKPSQTRHLGQPPKTTLRPRRINREEVDLYLSVPARDSCQATPFIGLPSKANVPSSAAKDTISMIATRGASDTVSFVRAVESRPPLSSTVQPNFDTVSILSDDDSLRSPHSTHINNTGMYHSDAESEQTPIISNTRCDLRGRIRRSAATKKPLLPPTMPRGRATRAAKKERASAIPADIPPMVDPATPSPSKEEQYSKPIKNDILLEAEEQEEKETPRSSYSSGCTSDFRLALIALGFGGSYHGDADFWETITSGLCSNDAVC